MSLGLDDLCPYKSLILGEFRSLPPDVVIALNKILDDVVSVLKLSGTDPNLQLMSRMPIQPAGALQAGFVHFIQKQKAPWTNDGQITDTFNHLCLVCSYRNLVAIYLSEPGFKQKIAQRLDDKDGVGLNSLARVARGRLNAAFVTGEARTLWLSGIHRRTFVKADSKILSGVDLRSALNPLDDQTYNFTAARCSSSISGERTAIGVAPRRSRVWFGISRSWDEFVESTLRVLKHLDGVNKKEPSPLPILARVVADGSKVKDAFDVSFQPPELAGDDPSTATQLEDLERWAYETSFEVTGAGGPDFTATLSRGSTRIGDFGFKLDLANPEHVNVSVVGKPSKGKADDDFDKALRLCRHPQWLTIRYDSGHTVSDGAIHEIQHRDMPFTQFKFIDFTGFAVDTEKPIPLNTVGRKKSLFCWVQKNWPLPDPKPVPGGWLACDDGAMEIADFIHVDVSSSVPILSLIHVKGAGSLKPNRSISVSKYEVVTGQAVKNLRFLDRLLIDEGLSAGLGKKISKLVWKDRTQTKRDALLKELKKIGANFKRRVVIVQPHVTERNHKNALAHPQSPGAARLRQLDTLLIGAEMNCRALGADLIVVAAK